MNQTITADIENASKFHDWITRRGGIAVWRSVYLSDPGAEVFTPAYDTDGKPYSKPHWKYAAAPDFIVTDPSKVILNQYQELKRFHIAIRLGGSGMMLKCTDASTRKIKRAVEQAGENARYEFDYLTQEAVILVPESTVTLDTLKF